ncbi:MAG: hypothetical protein DWQ01_04740 [Planctomycetota bacterium]|nr:MAG: hypothetical protein DWQ01_04740 [Planctomycetota bacterium]
MSGDEKIMTLNPNPGAGGTRISLSKYTAMRKALLQVVPKSGDGVAYRDLKQLVGPKLPKAEFEGASIAWYLTVVKLDLEARGEIQRVAGAKPQRLLRKG